MGKISLRRGFKTEANGWARDLRLELGLRPIDPLCPWSLAEHLAVPVYSAERLLSAEALLPLTPDTKGVPFSAVTLFDGTKAFVVQSSFVSKKRQASDLAHELAHIVLRHDPRTISWIDGQRHYDAIAEEEAKWLGPALLVSEEAALWIASQQLTVRQASDIFNATEDVVRMRLNVTGAFRRSRTRAA